MNIFELMKKMGDPTDVWVSALKRGATEESFYLYELHEMGPGLWENGLFVFSTPQDFGQFTYALELFDFVYFDDWEEVDESEDYSELYQYLVQQREKEWTFGDCVRYVSAFKPSSIELIHFGKIRDLLEVSTDTFEKCKEIYTSNDELEVVGLNEAQYQILYKYSHEAKGSPKDDLAFFLDFFQTWI
jgi:hypothetical protein